MQAVPDHVEIPELENPIAVMTDGTMDLEEYISLGRVPWEVRAERIRELCPEVDQLDWNRALDKDIDLYARVIRDIIKLEQAPSGRPGPRPSLDVSTGTRRVMQLLGQDFTIEPFHDALRTLAGGKSVRQLARHVGLNTSATYRLLQSDNVPDGYSMRICAEAFGKHPSYFLEWRILYIVAAVTRRLEWSPDSSIDLYRLLDEQSKGGA